jgi:multidrug efflux pump subunit AcrA (membrane-fusion protein)
LSKRLTGLMEAERLRRQREGAGTLPPVAPVVPGRSVPELVATADIDAETESRLAAERIALESLDRRIEEEAAALAAAQRNERGAAQLAAAAAARAANEANLTRLAQERATAERRAADRAAAQLKAELAVEVAAKARVAAEGDANQQARRRVELEAEVSRSIEAWSREVPAQPIAVESAAREQISQEPPPRGRLLAAIPMAMVIGMAAGLWLGRPAPVVPFVGAGDTPVSGPSRTDLTVADPHVPYLRLDHDLRAVPSTKQ